MRTNKRLLRPVLPSRKSEEELRRLVLSTLVKTFLRPVQDLLKQPPVKNARGSALERAVREGRLEYDFRTGRFVGRLDAAVSRELRAIGAQWRKGGFDLPRGRLSPGLLAALEDAHKAAQAIREKIGSLESAAIPTKAFEAQFRRAAQRADRDTLETLPPLPLPAAHKEALRAGYLNDLTKSIRGFTEERSRMLRAAVMANVEKGTRREQLERILKNEYGIAARRAAFLARQETNLLTAKIREARYAEAGIDEYRWQCVRGTAAHPVRHMHRLLDGTIQRFSDPPITNPQGKKNSPGCDFNCRCFARPIVKISS